jgi:hypothetical protein
MLNGLLTFNGGYKSILVVSIAIIGAIYVLTMRSASAITKITSNQRSDEIA